LRRPATASRARDSGKLQCEAEQLAEEINARHGSATYKPIESYPIAILLRRELQLEAVGPINSAGDVSRVADSFALC